MAKPSKYRSRKVTIDGITFDSVHEGRRWQELKLLEKAGVITGLQRQVKYVLIPAQREPCVDLYTKGKNKGRHKAGNRLERECSYYADFVYTQNGETIVEDAKGVRTEAYKIKRKLMLWVHGIQIHEV